MIERLLSDRLAARQAQNFSDSKRSVSIQLWHQPVLGERLVVSPYVGRLLPIVAYKALIEIVDLD